MKTWDSNWLVLLLAARVREAGQLMWVESWDRVSGAKRRNHHAELESSCDSHREANWIVIRGLD
jgi:hypothetical protein